MNIQLKVDQASVDQSKLMFAKLQNIYPKVISRAINKTLTTVRAAAVDLIYQDLNLTKTKIRASFDFKRATYSDASGAVYSKSKPIGLIEFSGTRELARGGVSVQVLRSKPREKLLHAFMAQKKAGGVSGGTSIGAAVFERSKDIYKGRTFKPLMQYARLPKKYRLPIDQLYGPRITDIYSRGPVLDAVQTRAGEAYTSNVNHELDYELGLLR